MEKKEEPGLILAKTLEKSFWRRKTEKEPGVTMNPEYCTGSSLFKNYRAYFTKGDLLSERIGNTSLDDFLSSFGVWLYDNGYDLKSKSVIRSVLGTQGGANIILAYMGEKSKTDEKNRSVMGSILLSIRFICLHTLKIDKTSKPSKILLWMIEGGSISRYIGTSISNHLLCLVPDIEEMMTRYSRNHYEVLNGKPIKMIDPEYSSFLKSLPIYKQEAKSACLEYGFHGAILEKMDKYYESNKEELESVLKNLK